MDLTLYTTCQCCANVETYGASADADVVSELAEELELTSGTVQLIVM